MSPEIEIEVKIGSLRKLWLQGNLEKYYRIYLRVTMREKATFNSFFKKTLHMNELWILRSGWNKKLNLLLPNVWKYESKWFKMFHKKGEKAQSPPKIGWIQFKIEKDLSIDPKSVKIQQNFWNVSYVCWWNCFITHQGFCNHFQILGI